MKIKVYRMVVSGELMHINYSVEATPYGRILIASTDKGVCLVNFIQYEENDIILVEKKLKKLFGKCILSNIRDEFQELTLRMIRKEDDGSKPLKLFLKGTDFQFAVWKTISEIPEGELVSYKDIAIKSGYPNALRATGSAVGANPVAILIPCHRVIRSDGDLGNYRYGKELKRILLTSF